MEKRGLSHIEVVLAFILFIGSVMTIFYFFNPSRTDYSDSYLVENLFEKMKDNMSEKVMYYDVKIGDISGQPIISVSLGEFIPNGDNIAVWRSNGNQIVKSKISPLDRKIFCFNGASIQDNIAIVTLSADITDLDTLPQDCDSMSPGEYSLAYSEEELIITEQNMEDFRDDYSAKYSTLKNDFGLKASAQFDFSIKLPGSPNIEQKKEIPEEMEVKSINKRVKVLRKDGTLDYADINVRLWLT